MLERITELLKRELGLESGRLGHGAIERAVRERMAARKLAGADRYWALLMESAEERQELIDAVVVPETWFFRDRGAFDALVAHALAQWRASRALGPMRLLSIPCSTGEEPYSMAMALLDAGLEGSAFQIDAIDVSERSLGVAREATYRRNSFRGSNLEFRNRYFDAQADVFRLRSSVATRVRFRRANLFDHGLTQAGPYDVVFCRNLLIYFDQEAQERALKILARLLSAGGILFLGPSEAGLALAHRWIAIKAPLSFAFRLPAADSETAKPVAVPAREAGARRASPSAPLRRPARSRRSEASRSEAPALPARPLGEALLSEAGRLADEGRYREARARCESFVQQHGPNARALFLLGLVRGAEGDASGAATFYRKALYLDPAHHDALIHYALLLERQGDAEAANVLRERMRRRAVRAGEQSR